MYARTAKLSDAMRAEVVLWPTFDRWSVGIQLVRAADSIGANIAEAYGRVHAADQRRFLHIARGSVNETEHWLGRASARTLPADRAWSEEIGAIGRMLNGLIASHERLAR